MSDESIRQLTQAVRDLTIATQTLTRELRRQQPSSAPAPAGARVIELTRVPFPTEFPEVVLRNRWRDIEDISANVPDYCIRACRDRLSAKAPGPEARASAAYRSGVWAKVAIDTCTPYNQDPAQGLRNNHWVVLSHAGGEPFRTTSRTDFEALCRPAEETTIWAAFDSITEAEVFCLGAEHHLPSLKTQCWRIRWSMLQKETMRHCLSLSRHRSFCQQELVSLAWEFQFSPGKEVFFLQSRTDTFLMRPWS